MTAAERETGVADGASDPRRPDAVIPLAAVLAHWRSAWFDMSWRETFDHVQTKQPEAMAALTASVKESGIREPIILGTDGRVWDGHHRLAAACRLDLSYVPVAFAALSGWSATDGSCPSCGLPKTVHALWCPSRVEHAERADDVIRRVHAVFADPSRAWFAQQFWTAYEKVSNG